MAEQFDEYASERALSYSIADYEDLPEGRALEIARDALWLHGELVTATLRLRRRNEELAAVQAELARVRGRQKVFLIRRRLKFALLKWWNWA